MYRMNAIVKMIRKDGAATIVLNGEAIEIGFANSGRAGELVMLGGGYYIVSTADGRRLEIAKGQLIEVREGDDLDTMTFPQLMEIARSIKLRGRGTARKPQLIAGIRAHRAA